MAHRSKCQRSSGTADRARSVHARSRRAGQRERKWPAARVRVGTVRAGGRGGQEDHARCAVPLRRPLLCAAPCRSFQLSRAETVGQARGGGGRGQERCLVSTCFQLGQLGVCARVILSLLLPRSWWRLCPPLILRAAGACGSSLWVAVGRGGCGGGLEDHLQH